MKETQKKKSFSFIDLFAGIGGLRIPFEELGGKCVFSCEIDKHCQQTYQANFGEVPFGNIRLLDISKLPNHDLLLAGFPCQAFSIAGHKHGFQDERGNLIFEIIEILKYHQPNVFLLENVKGLTYSCQKENFEIILSSLEDCGYEVSYQVLNARDFGLPQNRERIFLVGTKKGSEPFTFPRPTYEKTRLRDILESKVDKKYTLTPHLWKYIQERKKLHQKRGNGFGYSLFTPDSSYTSTLSARYYKDGAEILVEQKNNIPRRLTPHECAQLMGFPESFKIVVSDTSAYKQFGNSVAINVIKVLAKKIVNHYLLPLSLIKGEKINCLLSPFKENNAPTELSW